MGQSIPMEVAYFRLTPGIQRRRSVSSVRMVQIECNKKTFLFAAALASFYSVIVASQLRGLQASSTTNKQKIVLAPTRDVGALQHVLIHIVCFCVV